MRMPSDNYASYRANFIIHTAIPVLVLPLLTSILLTFRLAPSVSWISFIGIQVLSIILWNTAWIQYDDIFQRRAAAQLGAQMVPRIKGRWPGNIDLLFKKSKEIPYMGQRLEDLFHEYGTTTLNMRTLWVDNFISIDEGVVKYILSTGFEHFDKGRRSKELRDDFLGAGIFNRDGDVWKTHRAMTRPFFARERIADFAHFERYTSKTLSVIDGLGEGTAFDAQDLFARFTVDAAATFLFNTNLDTLSMPVPKAGSALVGNRGSVIAGEFGTFARSFEDCQRIIVQRQRRDVLWPLYEWFKNDMKEPVMVIKEWLDPIVEKTCKAVELKKQDGESVDIENSSFLEYLAASTDDVTMIRTELLNILLAARDSTAALLTFVIYLFTQHPDVTSRLRAEILAACPQGQVPTYDDIRNMRYLRAVLHETLRIFPPVHTTVRASGSSECTIPLSPTSNFAKAKKHQPSSTPPSKDAHTLPITISNTKPLYIPPNKIISIVPLLIHRRQDLWGDDADSFDPDRWLDARIEKMVKNPMIFVPFNAGPRICLGQQFSLNQASFFLVRLLQTYSKFELATDCQPRGTAPPPYWKQGRGRAKVENVFLAGAFTLFVKGGLWVRLGKDHDAEEKN